MNLLEVMLVAALGMIVTALAMPSLLNFQRAYRVHSDSGALSTYLSVVRVGAASQYQPARLIVDPTGKTYVMELLTQSSYNPFGTPGSVTYTSQSPVVYYSGVHIITTNTYQISFEANAQHFDTGDTIYNCLASTGLTVYPSPVTADPSTCTGTFYFYFNTRGLPVTSTSTSLTGGGVAIYIEGQNGLNDAVTVSSGGAVQTWSYSPSTTSWIMR